MLMAPLHYFLSSISRFLMAARRRHSVAAAEKTARIFFWSGRSHGPSRARAALFYSGNVHKTRYSFLSEADRKWYVKCTFETASTPTAPRRDDCRAAGKHRG